MPNIYRIMHYENLHQLIKNKGQYSRNNMREENIRYRDISNNNIQSTREDIIVPQPPYQTLHDYVPFYFTNRSPMLYACATGFASSYDEGQEPIIYLVSNTDLIIKNDVDFVFTDGQANSNGTYFYKDIADLDNIDWDLIESWSWRNTDEDNDRKRRKQAEFLVHEFFSNELIVEIVVNNNNIAEIIEDILRDANIQIPVYVRENWYYQLV
ncbi:MULTISPECIES: type II toxin-antitoxin system toxin DNA ADP-ribosyl transferase DarT [Lysinibacillus]|uniref:type II toxin-antitoxin system toxin DNA ADP-ribosyl transferase DarT n=1 Tax=Lysinibacillus TaxID=400634 RepID=UPI0021A7E849|nr:DUF4433 domain-containing protein [Lysinibacillus capsici]MCT1538767.1 DUF4433 domain-containing protein [Lysinibacillus capsici]MCT1569475.1 DUF4433 domain-containing protein [Lysinibacillus capsici]MCT1646490.1 DUF4433 domain-containing protein [Lysinibacillus capsici]MCT1725004.1 DUF4433 domain-containing protein [Lysinibacillus capsici]MCT1784616.1 DUF4433 domain-containing protein [Lysinibacillus capsici]